MAYNWDIGCTTLIKQKIVTKGEPINIEPRRQSGNLEERIQEAINNLKDNDVIRKCNSQWNTPLVCVWKRERRDYYCLEKYIEKKY